MRTSLQKSRPRKTAYQIGGCLLIVLLLFSLFPPVLSASFIPLPPPAPLTSPGLDETSLATQAVQHLNQRYHQNPADIDFYTAYMLVQAGEDISGRDGKWRQDDLALQQHLEAQSSQLVHGASLVGYLLNNQNPDGSFGPLGNDYGSKEPLLALARVRRQLLNAEPSPDRSALLSRIDPALSRAIEYYRNRYLTAGIEYDTTGFDLDYRCLEALITASAPLADWVRNGERSLPDQALTAAQAAAAAARDNPSAQSPVQLAKYLTVLQLLQPASPAREDLITGILCQAQSTEQGLWFGGSIYDDVMVLSALHKAGALSRIDQNLAFHYLSSFQHRHQGSAGIAAGKAWGSFEPEEPDLTAQVISALSGFTAAGQAGSPVAQAVSDGLAYLQDIQDPVCAAIPAQWDSCFSTAETLVALQDLGCDYREYCFGPSPWVHSAKTKTIAQGLLVMSALQNHYAEIGDTAESTRLRNESNRLAQMLLQRHTARGFENNLYSDSWAYWALQQSSHLPAIAATAAPYLLSKQSSTGDAFGSWGESWNNDYYPDFLSTCQILRLLAGWPELAENPNLTTAITHGLQFLQSRQQSDGSIYNTSPFPDDPLIDTAEAVVTLLTFGIDPADWKSGGNTPVSYLLANALNQDGSFGPLGNILDGAEALYVFSRLAGSEPATPTPLALTLTPSTIKLAVGEAGRLTATVSFPGGISREISNQAEWSSADPQLATVSQGTVQALKEGSTLIHARWQGLTASVPIVVEGLAPGQDVPLPNTLLVDIAVVGKAGQLLYGPAPLILDRENRYGPTPLGALAGTGLPYAVTKAGFVHVISGQANAGSNGWMYQVNGQTPMLGATDYQLNEGDQVLWWYSEGLDASPPSWKELSSPQPEQLMEQQPQAQPELLPVTDLASLCRLLPAGLQPREELSALLPGLLEQAPPSPALDSQSALTTVIGSVVPAPLTQVWKQSIFSAPDELLHHPDEESEVAALWDEQEQLALLLPAGALPADLRLSWLPAAAEPAESAGPTLALPASVRIVTPLGRFLPANVPLQQPGLLALRLPLGSPLYPAAGYQLLRRAADTDGQWQVVPAGLDAEAGILLAPIRQLGDFALAAAAPRADFADLSGPDWDWAREPIERMAATGLLRGIGNSRFAPERAITRAEIAALLVQVADLQPEPTAAGALTDVHSGDWYAGVVGAAVSAGLVQGYEDGSYRPQQPVSRQELAVLLVRLLALQPPADGTAFADSPAIASWAKSEIAAAVNHGILRGFPDGSFRPTQAARRAEAAIVLYRLLHGGSWS